MDINLKDISEYLKKSQLYRDFLENSEENDIITIQIGTFNAEIVIGTHDLRPQSLAARIIYKINSDFSNKETFNVLREKYYANDLNSSMNNQKNLSKEEFVKKKLSVDDTIEKPLLEIIPNNTQKNFKENTFFFDKSAKKIIRYQKGFWDYNEILRIKS